MHERCTEVKSVQQSNSCALSGTKMGHLKVELDIGLLLSGSLRETVLNCYLSLRPVDYQMIYVPAGPEKNCIPLGGR